MADTTSLAYDSILSTTLYNFMPKLQDNFFQSRPMLNWLQSKDRIKEYGGGARIVVPIIEGTNSTAAAYSMYDTIPTTPQDGMTAAEYKWAQSAVSISIAGLEEAVNSGEQQLIDLLGAKTSQATQALSDLYTVQFLADGTALNYTNGLTNIISTTATLGGLDPTVHTAWKSYVSNSAIPLTIADMSKGWNSTAQGSSDTPDFVLTSEALWEKYESLLQPQLRYSDPGTADAGFVNLLYRGAPVCFDNAVDNSTILTGVTSDSGPVYFLNSKYLWLGRHAQKWFKQTDFKTPPNQDARFAQILCYGQLLTNNRRRLGKLTGRTQ